MKKIIFASISAVNSLFLFTAYGSDGYSWGGTVELSKNKSTY